MIWLWDLLQLMLSPSDGFLLFDFFSHKIELRRCLFAVLIGRVRSEVSTGPSYVFQSLSLHSFTILIIYLPLVHIRCLLVRQNVCQDYQRVFFTRLFRPQECLLFSAIQEIWRQWRFFFFFWGQVGFLILYNVEGSAWWTDCAERKTTLLAKEKGGKKKKKLVNIGTLFEDNKCVCQTANLSIGL